MRFAVVGVEHRTCPVPIREKLALNGPQSDEALMRLAGLPSIDETLLISTCARTEAFVWSDGDLDLAIAESAQYLAGLHPPAIEYIRELRGREAVRHAFRVTSGLESQIVGEQEVTGQVRAAYHRASELGTIGSNLDSLFQAAIACSRRLRKETPLADFEATLADSTVQMASRYRSVDASDVLIVGRGKIARMLLKSFAGARSVTIASASSAGPATESMSLTDALSDLSRFQIVCCATRTTLPILDQSHLAASADLLVFDLGMPRNVDSSVAEHTGVQLIDVDDVTSSMGGTNSTGRTLIDSVLDSEVRDYVGRLTLREVGPIIEGLRAHVDAVRDQEIARVQPALKGLEPAQRAAVETLVQRMIDRMFHHLVVRLKLASLSDPELIRAAEFLFAHGEDSLFPEQQSEISEEPSRSAR